MAAERPTIRVLLVEDDEDDYVLTRELLHETGEAFCLEWAATFGEGLAKARDGEHDVYLLDYRLDGHDAAEFLQTVDATRSDAPFLVFTGAETRSADLAAMGAGADDFLVKAGMTPWLLERAIRYALERRRLMRQLREARQRETIVTLAGGVAHDFNDLLTTILGNARLGPSEITDPIEVGHALDQIAVAGTRAAELTRRLLAYAGEARVAPSRIDATAEVAGLRDALAGLLPTRACLDLRTDRVATVLIAAPDLHELVQQLVANAAEALRPGGGHVSVAVDAVQLGAADLAGYRHGAEAVPGPYVRLAVSDDGEGMTPDTSERAFEPFFTTRFTGRGLGLAAVDGIARANHGAVRLITRPANGTTVEVALPAA